MNLTDTVKDIAFGLKPDFDMHHVKTQRLSNKCGVNRWNEVKDDPEAHGKDFDYRILDDNVFMPACDAAQQFVYRFFPEGVTYYCDLDGWCGVVVDSGLDTIIGRAAELGLLSEEFYQLSMENEQVMRQGE